MLFNQDPKKPAQEVLFSRKNQIQKSDYKSKLVQVEKTTYQKYLGIMKNSILKNMLIVLSQKLTKVYH